MTITMSWVRTVGTCEELIFASDSRLSGDGTTIDFCPKLIEFHRSDCAIGFAGYTGSAYVLMHQLDNAISAYGPLQSRAMDLRELRTHALKIFNSLANSIETPIEDLEAPDVSFIFGGYSWVNKKYDLWLISYDDRQSRFISIPSRHAVTNPGAKKLFFGSTNTAEDSRNTDLGMVSFAGDQAEEAKERFKNLMDKKFSDDPQLLEDSKLDWEPFEVLRDMLRDPNKAHTIGGAPQIIKVYQHMNTQPLAVYWPEKDADQVYLLGRPVFEYENIENWILDPDSLRSSHPKHSNQK